MTAPCHGCGGRLTPIPAFAAIGRLTSDVRPWPAGGALAACAACHLVQKPVDAGWRVEAASIYAGYAIYSQSGGAEQAVFAAGLAQPRSRRLLERALATGERPRAGRLLDVGCGNGGLLRSCAELLPDWRLSGAELGERHRQAVLAIPGVEAFHGGDLDDLPGGYDLITLVHALEHIADPAGLLTRLRGRLAPGGMLLVQVPDHRLNPFDLVVADHCSHFAADTLAAVAARAGFAAMALTGDWIPKELSLLARPDPHAMAPAPRDPLAAVAAGLDWLTGLAGAAAAVPSPLGIFGTALGGTWLATVLAGRAEFFVDEDPARIGGRHLDRPILAPAEVPPPASVVVALPPATADGIVARLAGGPGRYLAPPPLAVAAKGRLR